MDKQTLLALSPLDGRYQEKVTCLTSILSEFGLMRFRVLVEVRWLVFITKAAKELGITPLSKNATTKLQEIETDFTLDHATHVKQIEKKINHDVKAIEYFLKDRVKDNNELLAIQEFIHFGCTSEDINNLAYALMLKKANSDCIFPLLNNLIQTMKQMAHDYAPIAMLARTHGQPATPTTLGKEIANVVARLEQQINSLNSFNFFGKLNGATGNYSALAIAYPQINWPSLSKNFIESLGLVFNPYTTQIEPHDTFAEFFSIIARINTILIDFDRDVWGYISLGYFKQKLLPEEVGSSTMPHKINPIDFENSEGNLGIANALLNHMIEKLPISRWQRDLSDSTVLRNIGVVLGHSVLAYQSTHKGLQKLVPDLTLIANDLNQHWEVLAEPIQMVMRRYKIENPYEQLKNFSRGQEINQTLLHEFISNLNLPLEVKKDLLALTPENYIGYAKELASKI